MANDGRHAGQWLHCGGCLLKTDLLRVAADSCWAAGKKGKAKTGMMTNTNTQQLPMMVAVVVVVVTIMRVDTLNQLLMMKRMMMMMMMMGKKMNRRDNDPSLNHRCHHVSPTPFSQCVSGQKTKKNYQLTSGQVSKWTAK